MSRIKKFIAMTAGSVMLLAGSLLPAFGAHAQVITTPRFGVDPIGEWIVLNGLFNGGGLVPGSVGTNRIGEWIVLNGLFNGGTVGTGVVGGVDPIGQWIVLNGLFGGGSVF
jgi:hypothetical protein